MGILKKLTKNETEEKVQAEPQIKAASPSKKSPSDKQTKTRKTAIGINEAYRILVRPLVSEKTNTQESQGKYTFIISPTASKVEVKKAVQAVYGVLPSRVNISNVEGKKVRSGRFTGRRNDYKKAIVSVKKGERLDIHAGL
ncbi:MAG: 50S ribosomal protein L23 [Candidatus Magasanikbacteria bacterium CG11_big_fil_rev_8_21_14_0_20_39_34]|uniref:Large ribosomal subunit protein uL23 n=1 Tax=Candidatus Magasanikbacteria bacterium CG11_big_fil_rev_8_21_14_0_20_39_34 TaxID=1974653 RepID=A0A2H0N3S5_9BACT|nr:MAG: 50S ribosomal protein L23 [Candidatus Magasanikbacteria bacterium CG11_big_fil_rev_8_21_14_0_20_39_34]